MIKAAVFDLDNTLYDYDTCNCFAMEKLEQYCGEKFSIKPECFRLTYGEARKAVRKRLQYTAASHNRMLYAQIFCERIGVSPVPNAMEMYNCYWDAMLGTMELYDYVLPLFHEMGKRGVKIGILSDLTAHIQHRKLLRLGIGGFIDCIVTSEEAGTEKPDRKAFEAILEKLHVEPEDCMMVGDSYERDISGAELLGMRAIHFDGKAAKDFFKRCCQCMEV